MAFIEIPEMPVLNGEEAIELLGEMIREFQQQRGTRLTEKQADALTKAANQIISMIRGESKAKSLGKSRSSGCLSFFKRFGASRLSR